MKIIYSTLFFLIISFTNIQAQIYIDGKNINEIKDLVYIEVTINGNASRARVNYGENTLRSAIRDKNNKPIIFQNKIKLLNFMYKNDWILQSSHKEDEDSNNYYIFIKKEALKEIYNRE